MAASSKRQMTMAKRAREEAVRERRARKQRKKEARQEAAAAGAEGTVDAERQGETETLAEAEGTGIAQ